MGVRVSGLLAVALALAGCATVPTAPTPERVQILALNDFHGSLEVPPGSEEYHSATGEMAKDSLGGAARLGAELAALRAGHAATITVAAGDLIGASQLSSALYLDEPTIMALNRMGLAVASVGNHEFDKGTIELKRMQSGGCNGGEPLGRLMPCQLDSPFEGARFTYLAGNVLDDAGQSLFPASTVRQVGKVTIAFIGMTLTGTSLLVSPSGTRGYRFADEADTANAEAARMRAQGVDAVVLLIHQGLDPMPIYNETGCPDLDGALLPVLARLDPKIRLVVTGHTHKAYACEIPASDGSNRLVTSAGKYGYFVTDIELTVDPVSDTIVSMAAHNVPVTGAAGEQADVAAIVQRYVASSAGEAARVVGTIDGSLASDPDAFYRPIDYLVADAQFAATRGESDGGAQFALMNRGGIRTTFDPAPDGTVTFGQIFALQPFGNTLGILEVSGSALIAGLETALARSDIERQKALLIPSANLRYSFDYSRTAGSRLVSLTLDGKPIDPAATYRVAANNFIAGGGDGFDFLAKAKPVAGGVSDLDALAAYLAEGVAAPHDTRVENLTP
ncbi:bifunctional metallophosphatase/5'-nucleotidase [Altererythrobacter salegens]|uniref:Bifunctional metallophosphatase/5'-nucleotidase n=1 Tax=Croceibacterium salegens TaxID=1737568 RepID=A0A6I4SWC3_9SPHN|nr:bifunctional metallophosphatase/5'-nucleotidase [Croceibacterium salegens]MXO59788.1 bifunctional metallophosphatase/5'-nucleotidase [Croceibacterium salegens]